MNQSKITQIIAINNSLMAVVKTDSGHWTYPVICLELLEKFQESGNGGNHEIIQEKRPLVTWKGALTPAAELPGYLGLASTKGEAEHLYLRTLTQEEFAAHCARESEIHKTFDWSDRRCAKSAITQHGSELS